MSWFNPPPTKYKVGDRVGVYGYQFIPDGTQGTVTYVWVVFFFVWRITYRVALDTGEEHIFTESELVPVLDV